MPVLNGDGTESGELPKRCCETGNPTITSQTRDIALEAILAARCCPAGIDWFGSYDEFIDQLGVPFVKVGEGSHPCHNLETGLYPEPEATCENVCFVTIQQIAVSICGPTGYSRASI